MTHLMLDVSSMPAMPCLSSQTRFVIRPQLLTRSCVSPDGERHPPDHALSVSGRRP
jgi:hypothetical protein